METAKGMITNMDQIYADVYSEQELQAMKPSSPRRRQSMLAKQPKVMEHIMPLVQEMQRDLAPKIQGLLEESAPLRPPPPRVGSAILATSAGLWLPASIRMAPPAGEDSLELGYTRTTKSRTGKVRLFKLTSGEAYCAAVKFCSACCQFTTLHQAFM
jgi:hypothetical protein